MITVPKEPRCAFDMCVVGFYKTCDTIDEAEKIFLKVYSLSEDSLPFVITGYSSIYKVEGYFPEIPDDIKNYNMDEIFEADLNNKIVSLVIFKINETITLVKNESIKNFYIDGYYLSSSSDITP